jgi:outer membrane putative beta-barrel porin/alpha-amylase
MTALKRAGVMVAVVSILGVLAGHAAAQQKGDAQQKAGPQQKTSEGTEHFQLKLGGFYDQGDFGSHETTRTLFVPVTFKYLADKFDIGLTTGYVRVDSAGGVTLLEGQATETGQTGPRRVDEGLADTVLKGRWFAFDDPGLSSLLPSLTPFAKVKFPTGDSSKGLSTGEFDGGLGLEFDKQIPLDFFLFGDASYTFIGNGSHTHFHDRQTASIGAGRRFTPALTVSGFVEWRTAIVNHATDSVELGGIVTYKFTPTLSLSPIVTAGLTSGAPDFSVGMELAWKFGKY